MQTMPWLTFEQSILVLAGVGVGLALGYFLFPTMRQAKRLRIENERLRAEHERYVGEVGEHFLRTADLVGEMTKSYAAVYDHLAGGARRFCDDRLAEKALAFSPLAKALEPAMDAGAQTEAPPAVAAEGTRAPAENRAPAAEPADATDSAPAADSADEESQAQEPAMPRAAAG